MILNNNFNNNNNNSGNNGNSRNIFNTRNSFNVNRTYNYNNAIQNLEKSKEILNDRYEKKLISNDDYIKKSRDINSRIESFKRMKHN